MAALSIFVAIALAGCAFLIYFLYALWREEFRSQTGARVEITKLPIRKLQMTKLIRLYPVKEMKVRKRL
jgi:threonine/homoserine/homoserine lactone efflux protein